MTSVITRYVARQFLKWFFIVLLAVSVIVTLFDLSELLRKASSKTDMPFMLLLQITLLKLPNLIQQVLPFVSFFASMLALWAMNRHREIVAFRAAGLSIWQILTPFIGGALLIGGVELCVLNPIFARMMLQYEHLDGQYFSAKTESLAISASGIWVKEALTDGLRIVNIQHVDSETGKLFGVQIHEYSNKDRFTKAYFAGEGHLQSPTLTLAQAWEDSPDTWPKSYASLPLKTTLTLKDIKNAGASPQSLSFWDLSTFAELLEKSGLSDHKYRLYWHALLARCFWLAVMVVLAASCSLAPLRQRGGTLMISIGAFVSFVLYFVRDITYALGNSGALPVDVAAWAPVALSAILGTTILLYSEDG